MEYKPSKAASLFGKSDDKPAEISPNSKGHTLNDIVNTMLVVNNRPNITSDLGVLVASHVKAKEDKKSLHNKIKEIYDNYKKLKDMGGDSEDVLDEVESTAKTISKVFKYAKNFVEGVSEFFSAVILPIVSASWTAFTSILNFAVETLLEFVIAPIIEIVTAIIVANPITVGIIAIAAAGYLAYKTIKPVKEFVDKNVIAPVTNFVTNILSSKEVISTQSDDQGYIRDKKGNILVPSNVPFKGGTINGLTPAETNKLANDAAFKESSNTLNKVNEIGYVGLYQFGAITLADIGYVNLDKYKLYSKGKSTIKYKNQLEFLKDKDNWDKGNLDEFLASKQMQDTAFIILANKNLNSAPASAKNDSKSTAGFIMAAHLLGASSAKTYFSLDAEGRAQYDRTHRDANGTTMGSYVNYFSGNMAQFDLDETNRNANSTKVGNSIPNVSNKQAPIIAPSNNLAPSINKQIYKNKDGKLIAVNA